MICLALEKLESKLTLPRIQKFKIIRFSLIMMHSETSSMSKLIRIIVIQMIAVNICKVIGLYVH